jgi:transcriptional regulator with XRE-family HTH domain
MTDMDVPTGISEALKSTGMSRRKLASLTGIPYATLTRIIAGERAIKIPEAIRIARATGRTTREITRPGYFDGRLECAARSTNGADMAGLIRTLTHYFAVADYLDLQAIE